MALADCSDRCIAVVQNDRIVAGPEFDRVKNDRISECGKSVNRSDCNEEEAKLIRPFVFLRAVEIVNFFGEIERTRTACREKRH